MSHIIYQHYFTDIRYLLTFVWFLFHVTVMANFRVSKNIPRRSTSGPLFCKSLSDKLLIAQLKILKQLSDCVNLTTLQANRVIFCLFIPHITFCSLIICPKYIICAVSLSSNEDIGLCLENLNLVDQFSARFH